MPFMKRMTCHESSSPSGKSRRPSSTYIQRHTVGEKSWKSRMDWKCGVGMACHGWPACGSSVASKNLHATMSSGSDAACARKS